MEHHSVNKILYNLKSEIFNLVIIKYLRIMNIHVIRFKDISQNYSSFYFRLTINYSIKYLIYS